MKQICFVAASPLTVNFFLVPHLLGLRQHYDVTLVVNANEGVALKPMLGIEIVPLEIQRKISPIQDLRTLAALIALFRRRHFDLVHSISPKAGLLAMLAARIAGVPHRLHTFTGQVWATRRGSMRWILRQADRVTVRAASQTLTDSFSQRDFLVEQGVTKPGACHVLGEGSVSGVDVDRFRPDADLRIAVRRELEIPSDAVTILFLGRMTRDKGIPELLDAFGALAEAFPRANLLLVGPDEEALLASAKAHPFASRIRCVGYTHQPERYVAAADLLTLPSHREGFANVILEAAAAGIPVVASRIYGITDAVIDGETGLLHKAGDSADLTEKLRAVLADQGLRQRLNERARNRVMAEFTQARLVSELLAFYRSRLDA